MPWHRSLATALAIPLLLAACAPPHGQNAAGAGATHDEVPRETPSRFLRHWFAVEARMQNTGDTREFRSLQLGCASCTAIADQTQQAYAAGGYYRTKGVSDVTVTG